MVVPRHAIADARRRADAYARELGGRKAIGFREPDRLNLERALIAASAVPGQADGKSVPLHTALARPAAPATG